MSCGHGDARWWTPPVRCSGCGHRVAPQPGIRPVETRKLPTRLWLFELVARWQARQMRHIPMELWDMLEIER